MTADEAIYAICTREVVCGTCGDRIGEPRDNRIAEAAEDAIREAFAVAERAREELVELQDALKAYLMVTDGLTEEELSTSRAHHLGVRAGDRILLLRRILGEEGSA